jgi:hypothetical protein
MSNPNFHASTLTCEKNIGTKQGNGFQTCMPCFQCSLLVVVTASAQNSWTNIDVLWPGSCLMNFVVAGKCLLYNAGQILFSNLS